MSDLTRRSASVLAAAIRNRQVSSTEVVRAHLDMIERRNPDINAIVTLDAEGALRQAGEVDRRLVMSNERDDLPPLLGVPITLKDCHETDGMRTTAGYAPLADYIPDSDGTIAERMRAAGAVIMGKTNVSELLTFAQTFNDLFGRTNNPWNLDRTPGGSSGGAGAAVAAMMTPLDIGSDIGGSIRMPASLCGILGLKPTERRVSSYGHIPDLPGRARTTRVMNCIGPMARSIDDLELGFRILAGPDGRDPEIPPVPVGDIPDVPLASIRVAWADAFPGAPPAQAIQQAIRQFAGQLEGQVLALDQTLPGISFDDQLETRRQLRAMVGMSAWDDTEPIPTALDYLNMLDARDRFIRAWDRFLDEWDVLICPVMMLTAFPHCDHGAPLLVDGVEVEHGLATCAYVRPFNLTGHPVVVIPIGLDDEGLPIGIQIVGPRWKDEYLLGAARAISGVAAPFSWPEG